MHFKRLAASVAVVTLACGTALAAAPAGASQRHAAQALGNRSLFTLLSRDGNRFDSNGRDFDIVDRIVRVTLNQNPGHDIRIVKQGSKRITAFMPTDNAVRAFVKDQTGTAPKSEKAVYNTLLKIVPADQVGTALLYHIIPGRTLTFGQLRQMNGRSLTTLAQGITIKVSVKNGVVRLVDQDTNDANPRIVIRNINKGNRQIAQGINLLLRITDFK